MNRKQLFKRIKKLQKREMKIIKEKNVGYSSKKDVLENFRFVGEIGLIGRMGDKLIRAKNVIKRGKSNLKDERIEDTLMDLSNYANLLIVYLEVKNAEF